MIFDKYNNIGLTLLSILKVIKDYEEIEYSKALLILPFTMNNSIIKHLKDKRVKTLGIEDLIYTKPSLFVNFNKQYQQFIPMAVNTLVIAEKMNFLEIQNTIKPNFDQIKRINFEDNELGSRWSNIYKASNYISSFLDEKVENLYLKLRIEL